ncbi:MAG: PAS domain-containing protein, partial [Planctomycetota bacterium]
MGSDRPNDPTMPDALLKGICSAAPLGVLVLVDGWTIRFANGFLLKRLGLADDQVIGHELHDLVDPTGRS